MASRASQQKLCPATPPTLTTTLYSLQGEGGREGRRQNFIAVASGAKFAQLLRRQMSKEVASESSADGAKRPTPPVRPTVIPQMGLLHFCCMYNAGCKLLTARWGGGGREGGKLPQLCARFQIVR